MKHEHAPKQQVQKTSGASMEVTRISHTTCVKLNKSEIHERKAGI